MADTPTPETERGPEQTFFADPALAPHYAHWRFPWTIIAAER